jgi:hypothetical protein
VLCITKLASLTEKLTTWSRVLLGKLITAQLVKKFPIFYGTQRFITMFTRFLHLSCPETHGSSSHPLDNEVISRLKNPVHNKDVFKVYVRGLSVTINQNWVMSHIFIVKFCSLNL